MKGFFIKKAFFDGWDNLIALVGFNLVYMALLAIGFYSFGVGTYSMPLSISLIVLVWLLSCMISGGVAFTVRNYGNYEKEGIVAFKEGFIRNIRHSLIYFVVTTMLALMAFIVLPFYFSMGGLLSLGICVVLFWVLIVFLLAIPFYFPLMCALPADRPLKTLKKCFIIVFDNTGFAIFFAIYNLFCIAFSIFSLGMIPGMTGLMLAGQDAIKLLMLKYDYLEENPDADRKHINWDDLLFEEKEKIGPRTLKNMIFPWKD